MINIKWVGIVHIGGMVLENIYGIIFPPNRWYDTIYICTFIGIVYSWLCFKDECLISYIIKKRKNPTYELGSEPGNVEDIIIFFPNHTYYYIFFHVNHILRMISIYIVNDRSFHCSNKTMIPLFSLYTVYVYDILLLSDYRNKIYPYLQIALGFYLMNMIIKIFHLGSFFS
jgi:hypothetical protein